MKGQKLSLKRPFPHILPFPDPNPRSKWGGGEEIRKKQAQKLLQWFFLKKTFQRLFKNCRIKVTRTISSSSTITITITITITNTATTSTVTTIILTTTAIIMITTTCYSFDLAKVAVKTSRKGSRSREKNAKVGWAESSELVIWFLG